MTDLPLPTTTRWQPLRAGLINLFRFDREEFRFAGGRLLLRGNNGTGKTRALALTLPFLLDGEVRPSRVEPDGSPGRRFEWHLLMDRFHERLGYTWIEFGRIDDQGRTQTVTLGCGLRAVEGHAGLKGRWFFITPQRIGDGLELEDAGLAAGRLAPIGRERLAEKLAGAGELFESAAAYRAGVDAALFGLGRERYDALVDLLIELRRPQLSRDLDEDRLSQALSTALPGLDQKVVNDVAEGFQGLDRDRSELSGIEAAAEALGRFNASHRQHLLAEGSALAQEAIAATAADTAHTTAEAEAGFALAQAEEQLRRQAQTRAALALEREAIAGREQALQASEAMRSAEILARLRDDAAVATSEAAAAEATAEQADAVTRSAEDDRRRNAEALTSAEAAATRHATAARSALDALAPGLHQRLLQVAEERLAGGREALEARLAEELKSLSRAASNLRQAERDETEAIALAATRRREVGGCERLRDQAELAVNDARAARDAAAIAFRAAVTQHLAGLRVCVVDAEPVLAALEPWGESPSEADPLALALAEAAPAVRAAQDHTRAELLAEGLALAQRRRELEAERYRLRQGRDQPPEPPPWRGPRDGRPGAPLWAVCEFRSDVTAADRAGIEAALQAAGLLDGWVTPSGALLLNASGEPDGETLLRAAPGTPTGATLATLLVPAIDPADALASAIPVEAIANLLASIALLPATTVSGEVSRLRTPDPGLTTAIATDGRWCNGAAAGRWLKPAAEFLGAGARAAARRARLAELDAALAELANADAAHTAARAALDQAVADLARDLQTPEPTALRTATIRWQDRRTALDEARDRLAEAQAVANGAQAQAEDATRRADATAEDLRLTPWRHRLGEFDHLLADTRVAVAAWLPAWQRADDLAAATNAAAGRAVDAATRATHARSRAADASTRATRLRHEHTTLEQTAGADVQQLLRDLAQVRADKQRIDRELHQAEDERSRLDQQLGTARAAAQQAAHDLALARERRQQALGHWAAVLGDGLLAPLGPIGATVWDAIPAGSTPHAADTTGRLVTQAKALLAEAASAGAPTDQAGRDRLATEVQRHLQDLATTLSAHNYPPQASQRHGLLVVRIPYNGREPDGAELHRLLSDDAAQRRVLLSARERQVIEEFLLDEAAEHLGKRLHDAEGWVATVNRELADRPMSTGMALRFKWEPAETAPAELLAVRERLQRTQALWSPDDRTAIAAFLQGRIAASRDGDPGASWQEQLGLALDYRRWHRFTIERRQDGRWSRLTKRSHGTGSGGEKAIALMLPMFAAAAAHYLESPTAPRLILLDEAFVGIDGDMRREAMGLLTRFDLDVVMTSEREWGCYDTVPALAICQLASDKAGTLAVTRYVWNGRERARG